MTNTNEKLWVADTNFLYDGLEDVIDKKKIVLMSTCRQEADKHKTSSDKELRYKARKLNKFVFANYDKFHHDVGEYDPETILNKDYSRDIMDNRIVACAKQNGYGILTNDLNLYSTAKAFGIEVETKDDNKFNFENYQGFKEVYMLPTEHSDFYKNDLEGNKYELKVNQYLIIKDDISGEVVDALRYDGESYIAVKEKGFRTRLLDSFKPKDFYQQCVLDSLENNQVTMIRGAAGSGKSLLALNYAIQQIERNKVDKLICFVNPIGTLNSAKLGYLPGTKDEKILESQIGTMLASKLGDKFQVESMIANNQLELLPFSNLRGVDTTGTNSIVWVVECQNLDVSLAKLALERIGETTKLILDGDFHAQVDDRAYEGVNNGMKRISEVFRGEDYYGEVELQQVFRSRVADKAQEM